MIVHCYKSPGYVEPVRQTVSANVHDKSQPVLVLFWKSNQKTKAAFMQRRELGDWTRKNAAFNNEIFEMTSSNMGCIIGALKRHKINPADVVGLPVTKVYYAYVEKSLVGASRQVGHVRVPAHDVAQFKKQNPGVKLYDNPRDLEFAMLTQELIF